MMDGKGVAFSMSDCGHVDEVPEAMRNIEKQTDAMARVRASFSDDLHQEFPFRAATDSLGIDKDPEKQKTEETSASERKKKKPPELPQASKEKIKNPVPRPTWILRKKLSDTEAAGPNRLATSLTAIDGFSGEAEKTKCSEKRVGEAGNEGLKVVTIDQGGDTNPSVAFKKWGMGDNVLAGKGYRTRVTKDGKPLEAYQTIKTMTASSSPSSDYAHQDLATMKKKTKDTDPPESEELDKKKKITVGVHRFSSFNDDNYNDDDYYAETVEDSEPKENQAHGSISFSEFDLAKSKGDWRRLMFESKKAGKKTKKKQSFVPRNYSQ